MLHTEADRGVVDLEIQQQPPLSLILLGGVVVDLDILEGYVVAQIEEYQFWHKISLMEEAKKKREVLWLAMHEDTLRRSLQSIGEKQGDRQQGEHGLQAGHCQVVSVHLIIVFVNLETISQGSQIFCGRLLARNYWTGRFKDRQRCD